VSSHAHSLSLPLTSSQSYLIQSVLRFLPLALHLSSSPSVSYRIRAALESANSDLHHRLAEIEQEARNASEAKEHDQLQRSLQEIKDDLNVARRGARGARCSGETSPLSEQRLSLSRSMDRSEEGTAWAEYPSNMINPDILLPLQRESEFFKEQLSIAQNTIYEYSEEIRRQTEELITFKRDEEILSKAVRDEIGIQSYREMELLGIPALNMKQVLKSRPQMQAQLLAQFQTILEDRNRASEEEVAGLSERLHW
jgi:hypothetical protein